MEQSPSGEAKSLSYSRYSPPFMEPLDSSSCSLGPVTGPYPSQLNPVQDTVQIRDPVYHFVTSWFSRLGVVSPLSNLHPLSAVRDCLFNIFAATLHIWRPSPSATRGSHAVVTGTHII